MSCGENDKKDRGRGCNVFRGDMWSLDRCGVDNFPFSWTKGTRNVFAAVAIRMEPTYTEQ
jgi:hypothetical protein